MGFESWFSKIKNGKSIGESFASPEKQTQLINARIESLSLKSGTFGDLARNISALMPDIKNLTSEQKQQLKENLPAAKKLLTDAWADKAKYNEGDAVTGGGVGFSGSVFDNIDKLEKFLTGETMEKEIAA